MATKTPTVPTRARPGFIDYKTGAMYDIQGYLIPGTAGTTLSSISRGTPSSRSAAAPPSVLTPPVDPLPIADLSLEDAILNGAIIDIAVIEAVTDANVERTMDGASTITITVRDKLRQLISSGIFPKIEPSILNTGEKAPALSSQQLLQRDRMSVVDLAIGALNFRLAKVTKSEDDFNLTFEDRAVANMRRYNTPRKAYRDMLTRAEFALSLVREVKEEPQLQFYCPELHVVQEISQESSNTPSVGRDAAAEADSALQPGFAPGARITVKGASASSNQRETIEAVLNEGMKHKVPKFVMIALVMVITQENTATNAPGGDRDSTGAFQQRSSTGWKGSLLSIPNQVNNFLYNAPTEPFIRVYRNNYGKRTLGWMISQTQRDYTFGGSGQGRDFQQWRLEAERTVDTFLGGSAAGSNLTSGSGTVTEPGRYEFSRGQTGSPEDTWTCLGRLAEEVGWRRFIVGNYVYFISEVDLFRARPRMLLDESSPGVDYINFDIDVGKDVSEATIEARADLWEAPPGSLVELTEKMGPAAGRWLVASVSRPLFTADTTIALKKPAPEKPEPSPAQVSIPAVPGGPAAGQTDGFGDPLRSMSPITGKFGEDRGSHMHAGVDIAQSAGTSVYAIGAGKVTLAGGNGGYGTCVMIDHGGGIVSLYGHLQSTSVRSGQAVTKGQQVGKMDSTGNSTGSHLHFEIRKGGSAVNPNSYVPGL